jgi:hypothetical protein
MKRLMKSVTPHISNIAVKALPILLVSVAAPWVIYAQSPDVQQRVNEIKESSAKNKQALASYE